MPSLSSLKNSPLFVIAIFTVLAAIMMGFLIWPALKSIVAISHEISQNSAEARSMEDQDAAVTAFKIKYPEYAAGLQEISATFVDANSPFDFYEFIEATARNLGVRADIQLAPAGDEPNNTSAFQVALTQASFSEVVRFAKALELGPYAVHIQALRVIAAEEGIRADIVVTTLPKPQ